jgi:hypothetical protein
MTATRPWGGLTGVLDHQSNVARRPHYTVRCVALPLPRYPLGVEEPRGVRVLLPPDFATADQALDYTASLVKEGYRFEVDGPDGLWDRDEVLRRLNARIAR